MIELIIILAVIISIILILLAMNTEVWSNWHFASSHSNCNKCGWAHIMQRYKKIDSSDREFRCANCNDTWSSHE